MSLTNCKECGEQVSTKAESCPKCGAKRPKTSVLTWIISLLLIFGAIPILLSPHKSSPLQSSEAKNSSSVGLPKAEEPPRWDTDNSIDKMSGKKQVFATSPTIAPTSPMKSPYSGVKAWMGVGCDGGGQEWVFIGFTTSPNLVKTEIHDGYNGIHTRIKWDDSIKEEELIQTWGGSFLQFSNGKSAIQDILTAKKALLELNWFGQDETYFQFPMDGASDALRSMRDQCKGAPQNK